MPHIPNFLFLQWFHEIFGNIDFTKISLFKLTNKMYCVISGRYRLKNWSVLSTFWQISMFWLKKVWFSVHQNFYPRNISWNYWQIRTHKDKPFKMTYRSSKLINFEGLWFMILTLLLRFHDFWSNFTEKNWILPYLVSN